TVRAQRAGRRAGAHRAALRGAQAAPRPQRRGLCQLTGPLKAPDTARWGVVALLTAALFLNYIDRGLLSTAAPLMQDELGFSAEQLGWLLSAFFWSYALLQIPVGWLAEHFGAARVLGVALAVWAGATMLTGTAHTLSALLLLRVLLGVGESA